MRRWLVRVLLAVLVVVLGLGGFLWWQVGRLDVRQVTPDFWVISGVGSNVGVLRTEAGAVIVDTMTFPRQGKLIDERVRELIGQPVVAILNTHYHLDHTHGNPAFDPGTKVVSTARTLDHLLRLDASFWAEPPAKELLPNDTFDDETHELAIGGKTIRAYHTGRGHTDGDLVVHFVEDRVLQVGDLFSNGHYPNIDLAAGGSVREWSNTMQRVLDLGLDFQAVVPGHGALSDRAGYVRFQQFVASLWEQTSAVVARGGTLDDAKREVDLAQFNLTPIWFAPYLNRTFVIERAYEEAKGSPRAPAAS